MPSTLSPLLPRAADAAARPRPFHPAGGHSWLAASAPARVLAVALPPAALVLLACAWSMA